MMYRLDELNGIRKLIDEIKSDIADIEQELETAETKGVFSYPRSKAVRKSALSINQKAKFIREESLIVIKNKESEEIKNNN